MPPIGSIVGGPTRRAIRIRAPSGYSEASFDLETAQRVFIPVGDMKHIPLGPLAYEFSRHLEPRACIRPGETIVVEIQDALSGQLRKAGDRRDRTTAPYSNPLTGPVAVEGAEPGDALAVRI